MIARLTESFDFHSQALSLRAERQRLRRSRPGRAGVRADLRRRRPRRARQARRRLREELVAMEMTEVLS